MNTPSRKKKPFLKVPFSLAITVTHKGEGLDFRDVQDRETAFLILSHNFPRNLGLYNILGIIAPAQIYIHSIGIEHQHVGLYCKRKQLRLPIRCTVIGKFLQESLQEIQFFQYLLRNAWGFFGIADR